MVNACSAFLWLSGLNMLFFFFFFFPSALVSCVLRLIQTRLTSRYLVVVPLKISATTSEWSGHMWWCCLLLLTGTSNRSQEEWTVHLQDLIFLLAKIEACHSLLNLQHRFVRRVKRLSQMQDTLDFLPCKAQTFQHGTLVQGGWLVGRDVVFLFVFWLTIDLHFIIRMYFTSLKSKELFNVRLFSLKLLPFFCSCTQMRGMCKVIHLDPSFWY